MLVFLQGTPTWRPENIINIWKLRLAIYAADYQN